VLVRRLIRPLDHSQRGVALLTRDGVRLSAHHTPAACPTTFAIIVAHGFTLSWAAPAALLMARELARTSGVVAFDFRGHGRSGGISTVGDSEVHDVDAAIRYARWLGYSRVATLGFSMGAAVVVRHAGLASRNQAAERTDAVATVSGPSRWNFRGTSAMRRVQLGIGTRTGRAVVRHLFGTRVTAQVWDPWPEPPDALAAAIAPTPLLIVHGDGDPFFGVDHAQWLYDSAREPKDLWIERGAGHAEVATSPELVARIAAWLEASARMPR
jgi:pimeloyl-ACP methyl ester carboxylesterase